MDKGVALEEGLRMEERVAMEDEVVEVGQVTMEPLNEKMESVRMGPMDGTMERAME